MASVPFVTGSSLFAEFPGHFQSCCFPKSIHSFVIDHFTGPTQKHSDPAIAKSGALSNKFQNLLGQPRIFVLGLPYISLARSRLTENVTRSTLRDRKLPLERLHGITSRLRACQFPLVISLSI